MIVRYYSVIEKFLGIAFKQIFLNTYHFKLKKADLKSLRIILSIGLYIYLSTAFYLIKCKLCI